MIETEDPQVETPEATGSLAARATARRQEISERKSLVLEVPGYEGLLAVEYRALAYHEGRKIAARHQRQHDDAVREIYIAADQLIRASVNSYELREDGTSIELGIGWGRELAERLGIKIHDTTTARQAVLACFPSDVLLTRHFVEYGEWLQDTQSDVDDEQRADFFADSLTNLAHNVVILEAPVDLRSLYESNDPSYLLWLSVVLNKVAETHKRQAEKAKRGRH